MSLAWANLIKLLNSVSLDGITQSLFFQKMVNKFIKYLNTKTFYKWLHFRIHNKLYYPQEPN